MTKQTKQKLSEVTWAIRMRFLRSSKVRYKHRDARIMLFRTRADAREYLRGTLEWVRKISTPVCVDVTER